MYVKFTFTLKVLLILFNNSIVHSGHGDQAISQAVASKRLKKYIKL